MKKITLLIAMLCTACLMASPACAGNTEKATPDTAAEDTTCAGPTNIWFAKKDFVRQYVSSNKAYENPCRAKYHTFPSSSDGHADDWAPYSNFYSQLVTKPQPTLQGTLNPFIPSGAKLDNIERHNPDDIAVAYKVIQKEDRRDLLRYILFRALKQFDGTVRVYEFEIQMQADTHYLDTDRKGNSEWKPFVESIPQRAYDHFNEVITHNRADWMKAIFELEITRE